MRGRSRPFATLAAVLDDTVWDYSRSQERRLLLTPVEAMFREVIWEIAPQHVTPSLASKGAVRSRVTPSLNGAAPACFGRLDE